ncbi:WD40 repeat domain-containing serine/threonine protein kinase [Nocardiopsis alba]|uniref:WD40 repeat domain-containing serine/threonine protein kinase n=1 Tax=Nocardiopsis alba TaxID=53437 RepID=UPI00362AB18E
MRPLGPADPDHIGPHRVLAILGAGGMGKVYLARTPRQQLTAIKVIHRDLVEDPSFLSRFGREVRTAQMVRGPFTPAILAADLEASTPWMATEYVPGPTLSEAVRANGPFPEESLRVLTLGLARALQAIHTAGLMHRDLKPGNVLISPRGPQVIDFGIARAVEGTVLTKTGEAFGTPAYTSPEAILGQTQSPASDVFSLAGVVVFAATGEPPFGRGRAAEILTRVAGGEPRLEGVPASLRPLLDRCLAKAPEERPTSDQIVHELSTGPLPSAEHGWLPAQVGQEIDHHRRELQRVATTDEPPRLQALSTTHGRRRTALIIGAAAAALVLTAGTGIALLRPWETEEAVGQASEEPEEGDVSPGAFDSSGPAFTDTVQGTYFGADGDLLYVHSEDRLTPWDWREGEPQQAFESPMSAVDVKGDRVAGGHEGLLTIWDLEQNEIASYTPDDPDRSSYIDGVSIASDQPVALFTERGSEGDTTLRLWNWETDEGWEEKVPGQVAAMSLSPDAAHLAVALPSYDDSHARVEVRETDGLEQVHEVVHDDPGAEESLSVNNLEIAFSPSGDLIAISSGHFETTTVHDLVQDEPVAEFESSYSSEGLEFTHDESRLLLGVSPNQALRSGGYQWDLETGEELTSSTTLIYENPTAHPAGETIVITDNTPRSPALIFLDPETLQNTHELR